MSVPRRAGLVALSVVLVLVVPSVAPGASWVPAPSPNPTAPYGALQAISCASASSCMAVGIRNFGPGPTDMAEAWNGAAWALEPAPPIPASTNPTLLI
jgi:hypothetical protein